MGSVEEEQQSPLVGSFSSSDHESGKPFERTGNFIFLFFLSGALYVWFLFHAFSFNKKIH